MIFHEGCRFRMTSLLLYEIAYSDGWRMRHQPTYTNYPNYRLPILEDHPLCYPKNLVHEITYFHLRSWDRKLSYIGMIKQAQYLGDLSCRYTIISALSNEKHRLFWYIKLLLLRFLKINHWKLVSLASCPIVWYPTLWPQ